MWEIIEQGNLPNAVNEHPGDFTWRIRERGRPIPNTIDLISSLRLWFDYRPCPKRRLRLQLCLDQRVYQWWRIADARDLAVAVAEVAVSDTAGLSYHLNASRRGKRALNHRLSVWVNINKNTCCFILNLVTWINCSSSISAVVLWWCVTRVISGMDTVWVTYRSVNIIDQM